MTNELCNPITKKWISAFLKRPKPILLIDSESDIQSGVEIAEYIQYTISDGKNKNTYKLENNSSSITIEEIRDLQKFLKLKADNSSNYSRFVIINSAEKITIEAQNSLLKLFEDMPESTIVILVTSKHDLILPTVASRCFYIPVLPLTKKQCDEYGNTYNLEENIINKAFLISDGRKSVFLQLIANGAEMDNIIDLSKKFITSNVFERQKIIQDLYKKEQNIADFMMSLKTISRAGMKASKTNERTMNWKRILQVIETTEIQISGNVQQKLAILSMSISV